MGSSVDAKITVSATRVFSGQDTYVTAGFGNDDNIQGFFDEYPNETSNMQGGLDFSSAAWVLIKLPNASSGGDGGTHWSSNGANITNNNSGNVGVGVTAPTQAKLVVNGGVAFNQGDEAMGLITPAFESLEFRVEDGVVSGTTAAMTLRDYSAGPRLGIGTTNPQQLLHINNTSGDFGAEAVLRGSTSTGTPKELFKML